MSLDAFTKRCQSVLRLVPARAGGSVEFVRQEVVEQLSTGIEEISRQKDQRRDNFENILQNGKILVVKKDIADTTLREKSKVIRNRLRNFCQVNDSLSNNFFLDFNST